MNSLRLFLKLSSSSNLKSTLIQSNLFLTKELILRWSFSVVINLALYLFSNLVLFGTIHLSKFAHMFYKPGAALQKRVTNADGSRRNLPEPADKPAIYGTAKRMPRNY